MNWTNRETLREAPYASPTPLSTPMSYPLVTIGWTSPKPCAGAGIPTAKGPSSDPSTRKPRILFCLPAALKNGSVRSWSLVNPASVCPSSAQPFRGLRSFIKEIDLPTSHPLAASRARTSHRTANQPQLRPAFPQRGCEETLATQRWARLRPVEPDVRIRVGDKA